MFSLSACIDLSVSKRTTVKIKIYIFLLRQIRCCNNPTLLSSLHQTHWSFILDIFLFCCCCECRFVPSRVGREGSGSTARAFRHIDSEKVSRRERANESLEAVYWTVGFVLFILFCQTRRFACVFLNIFYFHGHLDLKSCFYLHTHTHTITRGTGGGGKGYQSSPTKFITFSFLDDYHSRMMIIIIMDCVLLFRSYVAAPIFFFFFGCFT